MGHSERAREEARQVREQLRVAIQRAGLSLRDVERQLGRHRDYLRQVLGGTIELRYEHVAGILAALGIPPMVFFAEIYGAPPEPRAPLRSLGEFASKSDLHALFALLLDKGVVSGRDALRLWAGSRPLHGPAPPPGSVPVDPPGQVHDEGEDQEEPD